jgi:hypothetical protein
MVPAFVVETPAGSAVEDDTAILRVCGALSSGEGLGSVIVRGLSLGCGSDAQLRRSTNDLFRETYFRPHVERM